MALPFILALFTATISSSFADVPKFEVNHAQEGVYSVRIQCRETDTKDCQSIEGTYPMMIMNAQPLGGIVISIVRKKLNMPLYLFPAGYSRDNGRTVIGRGQGPHQSDSEVQLEFGQGTRGETTLVGWIRDPRFLFDLRITGQQSLSTESLYQPHAAGEQVGPEDVVGIYQTTHFNMRLVVVTSMTSPEEIHATASSEWGAVFTFPHGQLNRESGTLNLWMHSPDAPVKWILRYKDDGVRLLEGATLRTRSGEIEPITFTRVDAQRSSRVKPVEKETKRPPVKRGPIEEF